MEWTTIKEILNYSTPLAGLVVVVWATWRGSKWVAVEVIKPVFGPKGAVVDYLVAQREGFMAQAQAMQDLTTAFRDAGGEAARRIDEPAISGSAVASGTITGYSTGTAYRLSIDARGTAVVYQIRSTADDSVIEEGWWNGASYRLTENDGKNAGVRVWKETGTSSDTADDFKVWIP